MAATKGESRGRRRRKRSRRDFSHGRLFLGVLLFVCASVFDNGIRLGALNKMLTVSTSSRVLTILFFSVYGIYRVLFLNFLCSIYENICFFSIFLSFNQKITKKSANFKVVFLNSSNY